jgi:hypothetical protein
MITDRYGSKITVQLVNPHMLGSMIKIETTRDVVGWFSAVFLSPDQARELVAEISKAIEQSDEQE